jgi:hypothetical protein
MDQLRDTFNSFSGGAAGSGNNGQQGQQGQQPGGGHQQQTTGAGSSGSGGGFLGGFGDKINSMAGGGAQGEKNEDMLDKGEYFSVV